MAHVLWYAGALIVMTAMGLFSTLAFSQMGGEALAVTAVVYAAVFAIAGHYLWYRKGLHTPGGLLIAIAVSMAPLAVYGIQDALDLWGQFGKPGTVQGFYVWIKGSWIFMEIAAIVAAADRAALLSVPVHRGDRRRRALVHVDGPRALDRRQGSRRLGDAAACLALVRPRARSSSPSSSTCGGAATLRSGCTCSA